MKKEADYLKKLRQKAEKALQEGQLLVDDILGGDNSAAKKQALQHSELTEELRIYQAELELQNQELRFSQLSLEGERRRYNALFSNLPVPALVIDEYGVIQETNPQADSLLMITPSQRVFQLSLYKFFTRDAGLWLSSILHEISQPGETHATSRFFQNELTIYIHRREVNVLVKMSPLPSDYHLDTRVLVSLLDMTERQELLEENKVLQSVLSHKTKNLTMGFNEQSFDAAAASVLITDVRHRILYVNQAFCKTSGYRQSEVLGKRPNLLRSEYTSEETYQDLRWHLENGCVWIGRFTNQRKDGTTWTEQRVIQPFLDVEEEISGFISIGFDLSHQISLEDQVQRVERMEAISTVISGLSHEFNNLLGTLNGLTEVNLAMTGEDSPIYPNLQQARIAGQRAETLVKQLREGTRILEPSLSVESLEDLLLSKKDILQSATSPARLRIQNLSNRPLYVAIDSAYLMQTLINLLRNARDACEKVAQPTCWIKTDLYMQPEQDGYRPYADLKVSDNGMGMTPEVQQRIFDPFFTTKEAGKGSGLGMMQVLNFIKAHKGLLDVHSYPGEGTEITLRLPLSEQEPTANPEPEA